MPEGVSGQPVVPHGGRGWGLPVPPAFCRKFPERSHQPAYDGGKQALFSQLRGQREGGKPPDPAEGLYHLRLGLTLSHRRAGGRHRGRGSECPGLSLEGAVGGATGRRPGEVGLLSGKLAGEPGHDCTGGARFTAHVQLRVSDSSAALRVSSEGLNPFSPTGIQD